MTDYRIDESTFELQLDVTSFEITPLGTISGNIWIEIDGQAFPEKDWSDIPVAILAGCTQELLQACHGELRRFSLLFMDGPYELNFSQARQITHWGIDAIQRTRSGQRILFSGLVLRESVLNSFLEASKEILIECNRCGWQNSDIDSLSSTVKSFNLL